MRPIVFCVTGMVGQGVLQACLSMPLDASRDTVTMSCGDAAVPAAAACPHPDSVTAGQRDDRAI